MDMKWDIRREGRSWTGDEFKARMELRPEKLEAYQGKLLWSHEERIQLLGLLLENVGADEAVKLGSPGVWLGAAWHRPRWFWQDPFNRQMLLMQLLMPTTTVALAWFLASPGPLGVKLKHVVVSALIGLVASLGVHVFLHHGGDRDHE